MDHCRWLLALLWIVSAAAQSGGLSGDYSGLLGTLHLTLHLKSDAKGDLTATLDDPDQGASGLPCSDVKLQGNSLSFQVPTVGGAWHGTVAAAGTQLAGSWLQGAETPLTFTRDPDFIPAEEPSRVDGIWLGTLDANGSKLRIQLHVKSNRAGDQFCTLDSLDQGASGLRCEAAQLAGDQFSFSVPAVKGQWSGVLGISGNDLNGSWSQGGATLPLNLARQPEALEVAKPKAPTFDAALAPVSFEQFKSVLDRDLSLTVKSGRLSLASGVGAAVGILQGGKQQVLSYGSVHADSLFEIGSIIKTFTGLLLARMVEQGKVKLDQPVRELLPKNTVEKPSGGEITLLDLATQHSGLPRLPDNFHPDDPADPYADYGPGQLYEYMRKQGVAKAAGVGFAYSNLGFGLLGQVLSARAQRSYPALLQQQLTGPLALADTTVQLSAEQQTRFAPGHDARNRPAHAWNLNSMAGAGAIRSTAADMLRYLGAQLHPPSAGSLAGAIAMSQTLHTDAMPGLKIALAWFYDPATGNYWHNGATGGYSSYAVFNPKADYAAVVLCNFSIDERGSFADRLGEHIVQRLTGKPAVSLSEAE